ncbi:hypothetical protein DPV78_001057 [Talaromyces pinophilus]|nr:hypothetical protein DPV78_001057 [Talaromyces pinophilus]
MEADIFSFNSIQSYEFQETHISSIDDDDVLPGSVAPNILSIGSFDLQNLFDDDSDVTQFLSPTDFDDILLSGNSFSALEFQTFLPPTTEFEYQPL